jgi:hypothetical protein
VVQYALVATFPFDIWQAITFASRAVTIKLLRIRAQNVTDAIHADIVDCISIESRLAVFTMVSLCVKEAFQASASVRVAVSFLVHVPIGAAVARHARSAWNLWISKVIVRTL